MRRRGEEGQATLELALCLPIAALILAAALETGLLALDHVRVWHAAREAARIATVTSDPDAVEEAASRAGVDPVTVEISPDVPLRAAGDPVSVTVRHERNATVPVIGRLFAGNLEARATMRIETP